MATDVNAPGTNDRIEASHTPTTAPACDDSRFTSYNVRLQESLQKARQRKQDTSSVFQLPNPRPAKTDSYAGRLKSQLRRIRERTAGIAPAAAQPAPAATDDAYGDPLADQGCTD